MNTLLISFDLDLLGQLNYDEVIKYMKKRVSWARITSNVWLIKTKKRTSEVRDDLRLINSTSKIVVINVGKSSWASSNLSSDVTTWMKDNI